MKKETIVLGIHDGHNAGAALVKNGKVLAAVSEERFLNIKNFSGVPELAIKEVFTIANIEPVAVDVIAIASLLRTHAPFVEKSIIPKLYQQIIPYIHTHSFSEFYVHFFHRFRKMDELYKLFSKLGIEKKEVMFIEHHLAHAASAYYQRPWDDETLLLTLDGSGDGLSSTVNIGNNFKIKRIASSVSYNSIGNNLYSEITGYLGMKRWEHEYKVMGMAPYGKAEYCINEMRRIIRINPKKPLEFENTIGAYTTNVQKKLVKNLKGNRFDNISAACQQHFESLVTQWIKNAIKQTGLNKIACSGGMFLNVRANKLIREIDNVDDVFFHPVCNDEGTPLGAALEAYYRFCEKEGIKPQKHELNDLYYGREFSNDYMENIIKEKGWMKKCEYIDNIEEEVGRLISKGKIFSIFNNREEFGPRALGNRSIIADPRDLKVISKLNFAIKQRDFWMPFASSILEERAHDYLINPGPARYMVEAFDTTGEADDIIAGLHPFDKTVRPQVVNHWNENWRKLIEEFQNITGVGGILNTSFNLHGYPIVGSPEIALDTLDKSGLDGLAIGNWLILKS